MTWTPPTSGRSLMERYVVPRSGSAAHAVASDTPQIARLSLSRPVLPAGGRRCTTGFRGFGAPGPAPGIGEAGEHRLPATLIAADLNGPGRERGEVFVET